MTIHQQMLSCQHQQTWYLPQVIAIYQILITSIIAILLLLLLLLSLSSSSSSSCHNIAQSYRTRHLSTFSDQTLMTLTLSYVSLKMTLLILRVSIVFSIVHQTYCHDCRVKWTLYDNKKKHKIEWDQHSSNIPPPTNSSTPLQANHLSFLSIHSLIGRFLIRKLPLPPRDAPHPT